ncbi:hypothetical protein Tco_0720164 [Tanacetum coccineum]
MLRLGLGSFILVQKTWDEFVVRVGSLTLNPSPLLASLQSQPWMGTSGLSVCARERVIGAGKVQLNELNELRDQAYEKLLIIKRKPRGIHEARLKPRFNVGDRGSPLQL